MANDMVILLGREHAVAGADVGNPASITRSFSFRAEVFLCYSTVSYIVSEICALGTIYTKCVSYPAMHEAMQAQTCFSFFLP